MKKTFLVLFLAAMVLLSPGALFSEIDVICCRPLCEGCGTGQRMCDAMSPELCQDLGGWPVEGCEDCYQF
jgi:hypothetical protein